MAALRKSTESGLEAVDAAALTDTARDLWSDLSQAGLKHMRRMALAIDEIAPLPGSLVYIVGRRLPSHQSQLTPVVFSALDVNTHLQIAQLYLTLTFASAVDFLDFVRDNFPFRVCHVRTLGEFPFFGLPVGERRHEFTHMAEDRGIQHTIISNPSREALYTVLSKLTFAGNLANPANLQSERQLVRDLVNFLFFHNNHRSLPSLAGRTPLQKLRTFRNYNHLYSFDPFASVPRLM